MFTILQKLLSLRLKIFELNITKTFLASIFLTLFLVSCKEDNKKKPAVANETKPVSIEQIPYTITGNLPHDENSFTEGLLFYNNDMYESTGSPEEFPNTKSTIGPVNINTGKIDVKVEIDRNKFFGEGITFLNGKLYQLTYKNQICFIYDADSFKQIGNFKYTSAEGWGMTTDGKHLIMSDGTDKISFINPETYKVEKTINVKANGQILQYLNELEYINGYLYANLWMTPNIVKIDMTTGNVVGRIDFSQLYQEVKNINPKAAEMNGIAYNPKTDLIYITGKFWKNIYQVQFSH
jgi:glutamine cyclotransferase